MTKKSRKTVTLLKAMILTLLTVALMISQTGCDTVKGNAAPSSRKTIRMVAGVPYKPLDNGWFVPDDEMMVILNALAANKIKSTHE